MTPDATGSARFADILTTAAAVADYMGVPDVAADHLLLSLEILLEDRKLEELGRPVSPMLRRPGEQKGVDAGVRELVQEWFARLGHDANSELAGETLKAFRRDIRALTPQNNA
jgi:hypothetical protein